jgi:hypothetical protein
MCGCIVLAFGLTAPRFALILTALLNDQISKSFQGGILLPFLGWLLLPYATLTYVCIHWWTGHVIGFSWFFVVLAFLADLGAYGTGWLRRDRLTLRA